MFSMCEKMEWNHLPVAGGIYNQHPELLEQWRVIWDERGKYESEQKRKKERESGPKHKVKNL